jgi:RHS repeat-associated protein
MKKGTRRIWSICLTVCFLLTFFPINNLSAANTYYPLLSNLPPGIAGDASLQLNPAIPDITRPSGLVRKLASQAATALNLTSEDMEIALRDLSEKQRYIKDQVEWENEYLTERFIIKYKNVEQSSWFNEVLAEQSTNLMIDEQIAEKIDANLVVTEGRMTLADFKDNYLNPELASEIEYIQPDYPLDMAANDPYLPEEWGFYQEINYPEEVNILWEGITPEEKTEVLTNYFSDGNNLNGIASDIEIMALLHRGIERIDADVPAAWEQSLGDGVTVAVIDGGMDITHEDLNENIWTNYAEIPDNGLDDDDNGYIDDVHGWDFQNNTNIVHSAENVSDEWHATQIAGVIAATQDNAVGISGIAPNAQIMPLIVFHDGVAYTSDIINAIEYAENMGAKIINASWGSSQDNPALADAIANTDMLIVSAAGNRSANIDNYPTYPAALAFDNTMAVAALNPNGQLSRFSNFGSVAVDVAAPGEKIYSTLPGDRYGASNGTSLAVPFVVGEAALIWSINPDFTAQEVKSRIIDSSDTVTGLQDKIFNGRKINIGASVDGEALNSNVLDIFDVYRSGSVISEENDYTQYAQNSLESKTAMPTSRHGLSVVVVDDKIYAIGGQSGSTYYSAVEEYDPATNQWTTKASMPTARSYFGAVVYNGKIYCIGGYTGSYSNKVEVYDPAANSWQTLSNMPTARREAGVAELSGKIYALGGYNGSYLSTVQEYNVVSNTWSTKGNLTLSRSGAFAFSANGMIYLEGGKNGSYPNLVDFEETYDAATGTAAQTGYSSARAIGAGSVFVRQYVYQGGGKTFGEYSGAIARDTLSQYDRGFWVLSSMAAPRSNLGAAKVKEKIYFIGGETNGSTGLNTVEEYDLGTTFVTSMPVVLKKFQTTEMNGRLYVIGGQDMQNQPVQTFYEYEPITGIWTQKSDIPFAPLEVVTLDNKIYLINYSNMAAYDPTTDIWITKQAMNTHRQSFASIAHDGKIYVTGGHTNFVSNTLNTVEAYDPVLNSWSYQSNFPTEIFNHYMIELNGAVYLMGGNKDLTTMNNKLYMMESDGAWEIKADLNVISSSSILAMNDRVYFINDMATSAYFPDSNAWYLIENDLPLTNIVSVQAVLDKIYIFAGGTQNETQAILEYIPPSNSWSTRATYRYSSNFGIAEDNGKIYLVGGWGNADLSDEGTSSVMKVLDIYDVEQNMHETKSYMNYARQRLGAATINGKIYAVGGTTTTSTSNAVRYLEEYNTATDTWTTKTQMPAARADVAVAAAGGKLYVFGGRTGGTPYTTTYEYNPATNAWATKTAMPAARYGAAAATINGKIYVAGGIATSNGMPTNTLYEYDPAANTWQTKQAMPYATAFMGAAADEKLYIVGGQSTSGYPLKRMQVYDPAENLWTSKDGPNFVRKELGAAVVGKELFAFYGGDGSFIYSTVESTPLDYMTGEMLHFGEEDINPSGNFSRSFTDMQMAVPGFMLDISRTYNSLDNRADVLGKGWTLGLMGSIKPYNNSTTKHIVRLPDGSAQIYTKSGDVYTAEDSRGVLVKNTDNSHTLTTKDQYKYGFDTNGYMNWMEDRYGNRLELTVNNAGRISQLKEPAGRIWAFTYNSAGRLTQITDNMGRSAQYTYTNNVLASAQDPMGNITQYTYNTNGMLENIKDHDGNVLENMIYTTFSGEYLPKITQLTDMQGNITQYTYDDVYRSISTSDSNGRKTVTWYDNYYYPIKYQDADGRTSSTVYANVNNKHFGEVKYLIDRAGNKTEYARDADGNITKIINPDGSYRAYTYNDKNNMTSEKDETGRLTNYVYDTTGVYLLKTARALDGITPYAGTDDANFAIETNVFFTEEERTANGYLAKGLLKSTTIPKGYTILFAYDAYGNLITETEVVNYVTRHEYNAVGWRTADVSPRGIRTEYDYDLNGRIIRKRVKGTSGAPDSVTRTVYDRRGNVVKIVSPNLYNPSLDNQTTFAYSGDHGLRYMYNTKSQLISSMNQLGHAIAYTYDLYGNKLTETRPTGVVYEYTYDNLNRETSKSYRATTNAAPVLLNTMSYAILSGGRTQKTSTRYFTASTSAVTHEITDYADRLVLQYNADNTTESRVYYPNGLLKTVTDAGGHVTTHAYDGLNRLSDVWSPHDGDSFTYTGYLYDKSGNQIKLRQSRAGVPAGTVPADSDCIITNASYDAYNNKVQETNPAINALTFFAYDKDGNIRLEKGYTNTSEFISTEYAYNHLNKVKTKTTFLAQSDLYLLDSSNTAVSLISGYAYDKNGNLTNESLPNDSQTTFIYDNADQLIRTEQTGLDENWYTNDIINEMAYNSEGQLVTRTDSLEQVTAYAYNTLGYNTKITDARGNTRYMEYDLAGRLVAEVSAQNYSASLPLAQMNRTEYVYDQMDRLTQKKVVYQEPGSSTWKTVVTVQNTYDAVGNIVFTKDALGVSGGYGTAMSYDPARRLITVTEPETALSNLPFTQSYTYDAQGRLLSETDANGTVTQYMYDDAGRVLTVVKAGETLETNTYNRYGSLTAQTDGNGNTTTWTYNTMGLARSMTLPGDSSIAANTIAYTYNPLGKLTETVNSLGTATSTEYDVMGRTIGQTERKIVSGDYTESISTYYRYDLAGNLRYEVDANGNTTQHSYDANGNKISTTVQVTNVLEQTSTQVTEYTWDKDNRPLTTEDWRGNVSENIYDPLGRLYKQKDANGVVYSTIEYNNNDMEVKNTDALNHITQYAYDRNNRLTLMMDPMGRTVGQSYDDIGNISAKEDGNGNVTEYEYDEFGNLSKVTDALGQETVFTYDNNGNCLSQTDGEGNTVLFEYNARNLLSGRIDPPGYSAQYETENEVLYAYDNHGREVSKTSGYIVITKTYDGMGNLLMLTDDTGTTYYLYDELGRTILKGVPDFGVTTFLYDITAGQSAGYVAEEVADPKGNIVIRSYDKVKRLRTVTADGAGTTTTSYYQDGSKQSVLYPDGAKAEFTYNANSELIQLVNYSAPSQILESYIYTYDDNGNQSGKTDAKGTTLYEYDPLNRLSEVTEPYGRVTSYEFDGAGNRAAQTIVYGDYTGVTAYDYDGRNQLIGEEASNNGELSEQSAYSYDFRGNLMEELTLYYVGGVSVEYDCEWYGFDPLNRFVGTEMAGEGYDYNGLDLRVLKYARDGEWRYLYEGTNVILETDYYGEETAWNIWGDTLLARRAESVTAYYMYNGHGDVTALVSGGEVLNMYYYDAFGNLLEQTGSFSNTAAYAGYEYDAGTGFYYLKSRYYDPQNARFISQDTYAGRRADPLSLNKYTYCHNEPLMYFDPTGHVNVYGNFVDINNAQKSLGHEGYTYHYTDIGIKYDITSGSIIVGGTGAKGGVSNNPTGALRLAGDDRNGTIAAIESYKSVAESNRRYLLGSSGVRNPDGSEQALINMAYDLAAKCINLTTGSASITIVYPAASGIKDTGAVSSTSKVLRPIGYASRGFLTNDYFDEELKRLEDEIIEENREWGVFTSIGNVVNDALLARMKDDVKNNADVLHRASKSDGNFIRFFEEINELIKHDGITQDEHYYRNTLNEFGGAPEKLDKMLELAITGDWNLQSSFGARFHMYDVEEYEILGAYNLKFVSRNGYFEAVYNSQASHYQITRDPYNMGTYNYAKPSGVSLLSHNSYDVETWKKWGNVQEVPYVDIATKQSQYYKIEATTNHKYYDDFIKNGGMVK